MFLSEKDQQHQAVKKKVIQKKNKDDSPTHNSSEHKPKHVSLPHSKKDKLRKIQSEPSLTQKRKKENFFDAKDKRTYRDDVEGSSEFKSSVKRRKYPRLEHNFREDNMLSDEEEFNNEEEGYVSSDPEYRPPERERDAQNITDDDDDIDCESIIFDSYTYLFDIR